MSPSSAPSVRLVSRCTVKPPPDDASLAHPPRCELSLWDLSMLSFHYIQKGHLFALPSPAGPSAVESVLHRLKASLSVALRHFYPLAGRLVAEKEPDGEGMWVHIDCGDQGAEFVHAAAAAGISVADVLADPLGDLPKFLRDFFPLDGAVNYDGRFQPLLAVQVTDLADGFFLGCSFNHAIGDGTSFWNFFNSWAEIARSAKGSYEVNGAHAISRVPVHDRWFVDGRFPIRLPFSDERLFIERFSPPILRERMFHFTGKCIEELKIRANAECGGGADISSFQALSALMWRCITRLRRLPEEQTTSCRLAAENRRRLRPPLPRDYFGNSIYVIAGTTTAGELLAHGLGRAARRLHLAVASHTDSTIGQRVESWMAAPSVRTLSALFDGHSVVMASSPRFDMYGCDFGWGKAVALRSGGANKFDGDVSAYPGREGGGSIDLEVCLLPENMTALESDEEFAAAVAASGCRVPASR